MWWGGAGAAIEAAPAAFVKAKPCREGPRHAAAPPRQPTDAGAPGDPETCRDESSIDTATSELRPHRTAIDHCALRKHGDAAGPGRLAFNSRQQDLPVPRCKPVEAPPLLHL